MFEHLVTMEKRERGLIVFGTLKVFQVALVK